MGGTAPFVLTLHSRNKKGISTPWPKCPSGFEDMESDYGFTALYNGGAKFFWKAT